jgi:alpha-L-rhamnosidase
VGNRVLDPAQTDYGKRVLYSTYDITSLLRAGRNMIGAVVGPGWYGIPKLLLQAEIQFEDGTQTHVITGRWGSGGSWWRVCDGPITHSSVYDGETYDARLEHPGWDMPESDTERYPNHGGWAGAMVTEPSGGRLVAQAVEPVQVIETRRAIVLSQPKPGIYVFDIGQNLAGWARLSVSGPRGTAVTLRYAESLYEDGTVNQKNLRSARACDGYILKGDGLETWEPRFTYHGFRYIQVEGFPGTPALDSIQAQVVRSSVEAVGQFWCDHPLLNQLHEAIWWTEASNLHGLPTDCPQRDERMGWLNDMAARAEAALYNFDLARLLPKWLNDIADTQDEQGALADTAPYRWGNRPADPVSVCYLLIPWLLYQHYGDMRVLYAHYNGMKRWVDYLTSRAPEGIVDYSYYGDWAPPITEGLAGSLGSSAVPRNTPGQLVSTAFYAYAASLLSKIAGILGETADASAYQLLTDRVRAAFNACYWDELAGGYGTNNQACNALALYMELVPPEREARVLANLVKDIEAHDWHLTTGNLCTKYVMEVLAEADRIDTAYALVTQTTYPSWGYMLEQGATTIWERWEQATGSGMNSHNHPMFGSVGAWLYRRLAGIQVDDTGVGFTHFIIQPSFPDGLNKVYASMKTRRGVVESAWERDGQMLRLRVRVPVNSQARIILPAPAEGRELQVDGQIVVLKAALQTHGVLGVQKQEGHIILTIGSGEFLFTI